MDESAQKPTGISPGKDLLLPGNIPVLWKDQGSQPLLTPSMVGASPKRTLKASLGCKGHPLLTFLLIISSVGRKRRWLRTWSQQRLSWQDKPHVRGRMGQVLGPHSQPQPSKGPGSGFSHLHPAQHPPLFLAIQRGFLEGRRGARAITGLSSPQRPKGRERSSQQPQHTLATCELDPVHLHPPSLSSTPGCQQSLPCAGSAWHSLL